MCNDFAERGLTIRVIIGYFMSPTKRNRFISRTAV